MAVTRGTTLTYRQDVAMLLDKLHEHVTALNAAVAKTGDKVRYNGHIYQSTIDGNVWAPDVYPAGWEMIE